MNQRMPRARVLKAMALVPTAMPTAMALVPTAMVMAESKQSASDPYR